MNQKHREIEVRAKWQPTSEPSSTVRRLWRKLLATRKKDPHAKTASAGEDESEVPD